MDPEIEAKVRASRGDALVGLVKELKERDDLSNMEILDTIFGSASCDVCKREGNLAGVAASPYCTISFMYCHECLLNGADPSWLLIALAADCGGLDHCVEGFGDILTWSSGRYMPLREVIELGIPD